MKRSAPSSGSTFTAADVAASIARLDSLRKRTGALLRQEQKHSSRPRPSKLLEPRNTQESALMTTGLDPGLPRYTPPEPSQNQNYGSSSLTQTNSSAGTKSGEPRSIEPQERFDQLRREGGGYRPLHGGGYGDDVDAAFEECSNAPC
jgi:hypothetical protein